MKQLLASFKRWRSWLSLPAGESHVLLMNLGDPVAKWSAGVGGVSLAIAISFSESTCASFIQVYEKCQVRQIVLDAILTGRIFALLALVGACTSLLGLAWPRISKQFWYSFHSGRA
jgi:hypothetical protein